MDMGILDLEYTSRLLMLMYGLSRILAHWKTLVLSWWVTRKPYFYYFKSCFSKCLLRNAYHSFHCKLFTAIVYMLTL